MAAVSRTLGPLHFEDLEPHRFEDLVRALFYDFKEWVKLEATGRGGGDDGFDVRGWEAPGGPLISEQDDDDASGQPADFLASSRLWLIQCKREKAISPKKLVGYLDRIPEHQRSELDGLMFVAACDFSKTARDAFREWCIRVGVGEYHLWGKAELEDALFQPKNDGLLFAFFGVSLVVRRKSLKVELRARLATKRKIAKLVGHIGQGAYKTCLFRDPSDDRYPVVPEGVNLTSTPGKFGYNWFARRIVEVRHDGVVVRFRERLGYLADDGTGWDSIELGDMAIPDRHENPWEHIADPLVETQVAERARRFWAALPAQNRAHVTIDGFVSYDSILAIDDAGDGITDLPSIFVPFDAHYGPFAWGWGSVDTGERRADNNPAMRVSFFPPIFPTPENPSTENAGGQESRFE